MENRGKAVTVFTKVLGLLGLLGLFYPDQLFFMKLK
jgi:hypothetical protein